MKFLVLVIRADCCVWGCQLRGVLLPLPPPRQKTEALLRYHLYVDCMPPEGMQEVEAESLERMVGVARSLPRLKEPR